MMQLRGTGLVFLSLAGSLQACGGSDDGPSSGSGGAVSSGGAAGAGNVGGGGAAGPGNIGGSGGTVQIPVPTPVSPSPQSTREGEPTIAVAPDGTIAVAWIAFPSGGPYRIGYSFSSDGGKSFGEPAMLEGPDGRNAADPVLSVDAQSNFHLAWLAYRPPTQPNKISSDGLVLVSHALAGTTAFQAPIQVSDPADPIDIVLDKPWIIVTPTGALLVTYVRQDQFLTAIAARSEDGSTFARTTLIAEPTFYELVHPCASSSGRVYAAYFRDNGVAAVRASDDDGKTWPTSNEAIASAPGETIGFDDPRCVAHGNDVWVSYGTSLKQFVPGQEGAALLSPVRVAHSADSGATFSDRVDASTAADGSAFMHPGLTRDDSGALHVVYYAGNGEGDSDATLRHASASGGGSFAASDILANSITCRARTRARSGSGTTSASPRLPIRRWSLSPTTLPARATFSLCGCPDAGTSADRASNGVRQSGHLSPFGP